MLLVHQLEVVVINKDNLDVKDAYIEAAPETEGDASKAEYDADRHVYFFDNLRIGFYKVSVDHPDYVGQVKRVQMHPKPTQETFLLFDSQTAYTFRGGERVPYESRPEVLGLIISQRDEVPKPNLEALRGIFLNLEVESPQIEEASAQALDLGDGSPPAAVEIPTTIIVQRSLESPLREASLKGLRELPFVEAAGPIFHKTERSLTIFTHRMFVRFRPEVSRTERDDILKDAELTIVEELTFAPNLVLVEADPEIGERINKKAEQLSALDSVLYAEPSLHEQPDEDAFVPIVPKDFLWPGCWDRRLVGLEDAWGILKESSPEIQFGSPNIIIAVVDHGIKSDGDEPLNDDFRGFVAKDKRKTYKLFDFQHMIPNHSRPASSGASGSSGHGMSCAGVALARSDDKTGVVGAAPAARLLGLIYPFGDEDKLRMFLWAADLPVKTKPTGFPEPLPEGGADIFTCSIGFGEGSITPNTIKDLFDYLTYRGRNGKGCLAIFSAGNEDDDITTQRPLGNYEKSFSCAASTLDEIKNEVRATYSNFGQVSWCAPSSTTVGDVLHNPPTSYAVWTSSLPDVGLVPSFPFAETKLASAALLGDLMIKVDDVEGFRKDMAVFIGDLSKAAVMSNLESNLIRDPPVPITNEITTNSLADDHSLGEAVIAGPKNHENNFGGTSAATPLSAGICALVLSAKSNLTWVEARDILYNSAKKIDLTNQDTIGKWLDRMGNPTTVEAEAFFSKWYGHGRLDAAKAVEAALAYNFTRDLMIRKSLDDTGENLDLAFGESPDIWVRNTDPAFDPDPFAVAFDNPGPHQTPSRGEDQWVYARVTNIGTEPSLDAWVRFHLALTDGTPLRYPEDWEPKNGSQTPLSWDPGVYYIGEVAITDIAAGADFTVNIPWPKELIPPATAAEAGLIPSLLVEVLPLDGATPGKNNNLAQRRIDIND